MTEYVFLWLWLWEQVVKDYDKVHSDSWRIGEVCVAGVSRQVVAVRVGVCFW